MKSFQYSIALIYTFCDKLEEGEHHHQRATKQLKRREEEMQRRRNAEATRATLSVSVSKAKLLWKGMLLPRCIVDEPELDMHQYTPLSPGHTDDCDALTGNAKIENDSDYDVSYLPSNNFSDIESDGSWQRNCVGDKALWSDDEEVFEVRKENAMRKNRVDEPELDMHQYTPLSPGHTDDCNVLIGNASKVSELEIFNMNPSDPIPQQYDDAATKLMNTRHVNCGMDAYMDSLMCGDVEIENDSDYDVSYIPSNNFSDIESNGSWQRNCVSDRALLSDDEEVFEVRKENAMRKNAVKEEKERINMPQEVNDHDNDSEKSSSMYRSSKDEVLVVGMK
ncbi:hypothetical protein Ancab_002001 [Ancistrocladus abbreviatus]